MRIQSGLFMNIIIFIPFFIYFIKNKESLNELKVIISICVYLYVLNLVKYAILPVTIDDPVVEYIYSTITIEEHFKESINLIPIIKQFNWVDFILNILMTIPLGIIFPLTLKNINLKKILFFGLALGLSLEIYQYLLFYIEGYFSRNVNINDVIANFLGVVFGYLFFKYSVKVFLKPELEKNNGIFKSLFLHLKDKNYKF